MLYLVLLLFVFLIYVYGTRNFGYWKKKGIKHDPPVPFFGNYSKVDFNRYSITQYMNELYWKYTKEKLVGFYKQNDKCLLLRDPDLIKRVLTVDFHKFHMRGLVTKNDMQNLTVRNLFSIDGDDWRLLRQRLTPVFTSGKLKAMFPLIVERAEKLQSVTEKEIANESTTDVRDLMARLMTDIIGVVAFGIDTNAIENENSFFRVLGKKFFSTKLPNPFVRGLINVLPIKQLKGAYSAEKFGLIIMKMMKSSVMEQRNYKPSGRNDFIDLLLELKAKGTIVGESMEYKNPDGTPKRVELELDDGLMAAQVFVFFLAGFETSSSASSFTLHQLAFNPEEQTKVQEEIDRVLENHNNKLSYEAIREMKYLEMAFNEALRMLPPVGVLLRKNTAKYSFPGIDLEIDEGVGIYIPADALQNDPKYFDKPDQFRPERFRTMEYIEKYAYLPFGEGPRNCIGARMGLMQAMSGLAAILHKFNVEPATNSLKRPIITPNRGFTQNISAGLPLKLRLRK